MAKRGDLARESVKDTIIKAFADQNNFVAFQDKKIYVQAKDGNNGEVIQFAITMTMPKTPISVGESPANDWSGSSMPDPAAVAPTALAPEDAEKVKELMQRLGISD